MQALTKNKIGIDIGESLCYNTLAVQPKTVGAERHKQKTPAEGTSLKVKVCTSLSWDEEVFYLPSVYQAVRK